MHNRTRALVAVLSGVILVVTAGCGAESSAPSGAQPHRVSIVTAYYPFQFVADRVAGRLATVSTLTQPGAEPHDLELTPKQVASVSKADLVVYERSFQPAVDEAVAQSGNPGVFDTTTVVPLQPLGEHAEEEHEDATEHEGHDHEDGLDPHVWLDPTNLATIGTALAERLSTLDSANAAAYAANARSLTRELTGLDTDFRSALATCERSQFITQHAAFGYLARRYGLTQIPIGGLSPDSEPAPARIAEVQEEARAAGVTTIFYETLVSPAVAEAIAGDLGLKTDVLDPIEGITPQSRGQDYVAVMGANLAALKAANGCR